MSLLLSRVTCTYIRAVYECQDARHNLQDEEDAYQDGILKNVQKYIVKVKHYITLNHKSHIKAELC